MCACFCRIIYFQVTSVHRVLRFRQSPWLKKFIDFNTQKREKATTTFEKDLYNLMNNRSSINGRSWGTGPFSSICVKMGKMVGWDTDTDVGRAPRGGAAIISNFHVEALHDQMIQSFFQILSHVPIWLKFGT